jgi:hypothetical protein
LKHCWQMVPLLKPGPAVELNSERMFPPFAAGKASVDKWPSAVKIKDFLPLTMRVIFNEAQKNTTR